MGVAFSAWCRRCGVGAPEVGDFGYIGAPTLGERKRGGLLPFGAIYQGFAALRMVTVELAAFKAFLDAHPGHPIAQRSDLGEEDFDAEEEKARPGRLKPFRFRSDRFVEGFYELTCDKCKETVRANSSDHVQPFEEFAVIGDDIALFQANVVRGSSDNFYRVGGFPFDDVEAFGQFLRAHGRHGVRARLDRAEHAAPPPGLDTTAKPETSWTPPDWAPEEHEGYLGPVPADLLARLVRLRHWDAASRAAACAEVGARGQLGALGYIASLLDDPEVLVRASAAQAIGSLGHPAGVRALGRALLDEAEEVRAAAREALASRGVDEAEAVRQARGLRGPYEGVREKELRIAAKPEAVEAALRDPRLPFRYAAAATLQRRRNDPWARELALVLAVDPHGYIRRDAADALAGSDDPRAVTTLLALLSDYHGSPAEKAAEALGPLRLPEAVEPLVHALVRGQGAMLTFAAGRALEQLRDPRAVEPLVAALRHSSPEVRKAAALALAAQDDPRTASPLAALLADERWSVREVAARALGAVGGAEAAGALVAHLRSPGEDDRRTAVGGLSQIRDEAATLGLVACLGDASRYVRMDAARALAQRSHPRGDGALLEAARRGDADLAGAAWELLIPVGDPATEATLAKAIGYETTDEMRQAYLYCGNPRLAKAAHDSLHGRRPPPAPSKPLRWGARGARL